MWGETRHYRAATPSEIAKGKKLGYVVRHKKRPKPKKRGAQTEHHVLPSGKIVTRKSTKATRKERRHLARNVYRRPIDYDTLAQESWRRWEQSGGRHGGSGGRNIELKKSMERKKHHIPNIHKDNTGGWGYATAGELEDAGWLDHPLVVATKKAQSSKKKSKAPKLPKATITSVKKVKGGLKIKFKKTKKKKKSKKKPKMPPMPPK